MMDINKRRKRGGRRFGRRRVLRKGQKGRRRRRRRKERDGRRRRRGRYGASGGRGVVRRGERGSNEGEKFFKLKKIPVEK